MDCTGEDQLGVVLLGEFGVAEARLGEVEREG